MTIGVCTNIAYRIKVTEGGSALAIFCYQLYECGDPPGCLRWERAVETWPDYATYQTKTDRQIPVFVLEEVDR